MNFPEQTYMLNKYIMGGTRSPSKKYIGLRTSDGGRMELGMVLNRGKYKGKLK